MACPTMAFKSDTNQNKAEQNRTEPNTTKHPRNLNPIMDNAVSAKPHNNIKLQITIESHFSGLFPPQMKLIPHSLLFNCSNQN